MLATLRDKLGYHRYIVFQRNLQGAPIEPPDRPDVTAQPFSGWDQIPKATQSEIESNRRHFSWDTKEWMARGWLLWVATVNGKLASVSWTLRGSQCDDYFIALLPDDGVLWWTVTLPEWRGRGLGPHLYLHMSAHLQRQGATRVYVCCGDWNTASVQCIRKSGYSRIGVAHQNRRTGRVSWLPDSDNVGHRTPA